MAMTAATVTGFERVLWRPSAALRVAHRLPFDRRLTATVLAAIAALALLFAAAPHASTTSTSVSETGVAAQTDLTHAIVGLGSSESPATIGESGPWSYDFTSGCCVARIPGLSIDSAQFGRKVVQHAQDFGLDPSDPAARSWVRQRIETVRSGATDVRQGAWHPKGGGGDDYFFFREGSDVLVTDGAGEFVTILPGGHQNGWFQGARPVG